MKKLFISVPMKNQSKEDIVSAMQKMHAIAEVIFDEKLEILSTYIEEEPPEYIDDYHRPLWYLGESIKIMAEADYFIGIYDTSPYPGCRVERQIAMTYGIPMTCISIEDIMPTANPIAF